MRIHDLKPAPGSRKRKKRVGRGPGSGHGKTATRGTKGQLARTGGGTRPGFEGGQMPLVRRLPKRGFRNPCRVEYAIVNVEQLNRFEAGEAITPERLIQEGLVRRRYLPVKILGNGTLDRPLTVRAHRFSRQAIQKIEAAGGKIEVIA